MIISVPVFCPRRRFFPSLPHRPIKPPDKQAVKNLDGLSGFHKFEKDSGREVKFF
jgi:hypothetical protein